ncbi:MAG TPA: DUF3820 family protein [Aquaticitalea sp.]|nr:DUF3820 family protein [Aquaticitalea sp.]HNU59238.1 DUF3820 family protein [Aquaticitalea sp.]
MQPLEPNKEFLLKLANYKMPFGKYKGYYLLDIPEYYYVWFLKKGFPKGQLGAMMQQMYEIKLNGLEDLVQSVKTIHRQ